MMQSKYHNKRTEYNNIWFDSLRELARYKELLLLEKAGVLRKLELQPKYELLVNDQKIGCYYGDFRYEVVATGESVTEDVKGFRTAVYQLKKKLVKALYGVEIVEICEESNVR
jgi:Protein of unknown function (DUF1064)